MERVDGLAKPALGGRDPAEEEGGCGRPGSPPRPADSQSAANKVNARKHTIYFFFLVTLSLSLVLQSGLLLPFFFLFLSQVLQYFFRSILCSVNCLIISLADKHSQSPSELPLLIFLLFFSPRSGGFTQGAQI